MLRILLACSAVIVFLGYLSYSFYGDKRETEQALAQAIYANSELEKSLQIKEKSCEIDNKVVAEYQVEKAVQQDKVAATISKVDSLPAKPKTSTVPMSKQDEEIDIDSKLPVDLLRVLSENCLPDKGDTCVHP